MPEVQRVSRGPVSFLSDYGLEDEFVGVVHHVIAAVAPGVTVIDVSHEVPAHDVRAGALMLWRAAPWLAPGVILAVVDPGVGSARRAVAIELAAFDTVLVGPDNGLLVPAAYAIGWMSGAVELDPTRLPHPGREATGGDHRGPTFDGRDVFAPAAALLAAGAEVSDVGTSIDATTLIGGEFDPRPVRGRGGGFEAEVLWVDRFGNVQLGARHSDAHHLGRVVQVVAEQDRWPARIAGAFADLEPGEVGLVTDSYGLLALCLNGSSAAAATGLRAGDRVRVGPAGP